MVAVYMNLSMIMGSIKLNGAKLNYHLLHITYDREECAVCAQLLQVYYSLIVLTTGVLQFVLTTGVLQPVLTTGVNS